MMRTIRLNMTFSMALNFAAIVRAMTGALDPVVGALVHRETPVRPARHRQLGIFIEMEAKNMIGTIVALVVSAAAPLSRNTSPPRREAVLRAARVLKEKKDAESPQRYTASFPLSALWRLSPSSSRSSSQASKPQNGAPGKLPAARFAFQARFLKK